MSLLKSPPCAGFLGLYLGRNSINILEMFSCACHSYHRDHVRVINDKWDLWLQYVYGLNSIYSRDNVIPYLLVYCVGTLWCTAGIIWLTLYTHFSLTHVQPVVVLWISALCLAWGMGPLPVFPAGTVVVTLIYIAIITLTGVSLNTFSQVARPFS